MICKHCGLSDLGTTTEFILYCRNCATITEAELLKIENFFNQKFDSECRSKGFRLIDYIRQLIWDRGTDQQRFHNQLSDLGNKLVEAENYATDLQKRLCEEHAAGNTKNN